MGDFFSSDFFMPHGHCYLWKPALLWLQVITNLLIGFSYVAISATLAYLVAKGEYIPFKGMTLAFGVFIVSCALTHFFDVYVIWEPVYWVDGGIRAVTAAASVGTALLLPPLIPRAIALARGAKAAEERGVELETAVGDLIQLYEKTKDLDDMKTRFFANVSHELRTPLALIIGPAENLLRAPNLTDVQRRDLDVMLRNGRTLLKHVNDLLDVARLEADRLNPRLRRTDLAALTRLVAGHFDVLAEERRIEYAIVAPSQFMAEVDRDMIERVVLNLIANAFKFTPVGGTVRCAVSAGPNDRAIIEVADSGSGIPLDRRHLVFERFFQESGGQGGIGPGGLGLAIAKDFVELHHGTIEVMDAPEGGALFRLELPRRARGARVESKEEEVAFVASPGLEEAAKQNIDELRVRVSTALPSDGLDDPRPTVLVVEDNPDMNRFICASLAGNYRTERAFDGKAGLEMMAELRPDLVVTDLMMPGMTGDALVRRARAERALDGVPILVLTAKADDDLRIKLLREGAQDYVMKPFSAEELEARVNNLISMKRVRDLLQSELESQMNDVAQLASEVVGRKRELETALASLKVTHETALKASRLKTDFLRMVSHELRSPLAALRLQLERLEYEQAAPSSTKRHELIGRMGRSVGRLHELVESLLEYARVESGRLSVRREDLDVRALLAGLLEESRPQAEEKGLTVELDAAGDIRSFSSDADLLRLIARNLISNAIKFTEQGTVAVRAHSRDGALELAVHDTGPGIPIDERARIFEPFEQLEGSRYKHQPGVGLGLAIVREMVNALGGTITLESEVGRGSVFSVIIPPLTMEGTEKIQPVV